MRVRIEFDFTDEANKQAESEGVTLEQVVAVMSEAFKEVCDEDDMFNGDTFTVEVLP